MKMDSWSGTTYYMRTPRPAFRLKKKYFKNSQESKEAELIEIDEKKIDDKKYRILFASFLFWYLIPILIFFIIFAKVFLGE